MEAIQMGSMLKSQGYNIYASGVVGTGRMTTVRKLLDEVRKECPELFDFAYVNNFKQAEQPVLLRFASGEGRVFTSMMEDALLYLKRRIGQLIEEDSFQVGRKAIIQRFQTGEKTMLAELDKRLRPKGFAVGQLQDEGGEVRTEIFTVIEGKPFTVEQLDELIQESQLTMERAAEIREEWTKYREELSDIGRRSIRLLMDFRRELGEHDQKAVALLIDTAFENIKASFPRLRVTEFLAGVRKHLLEHLDELIKLFAARQSTEDESTVDDSIKEFFSMYSVNLLVDNYDTKDAPVIIETNPTYSSLFGTIEKKFDVRGFYTANYKQIRAGSLLRADGGFVVLNAIDVLTDEQIWPALRKVMLYGRLEIQSLDGQFQLNTLKPEWVNLNVKIILLGDPDIYLALWEGDEDFHKMFKVHAEFDNETNVSTEMIVNYTRFFCLLANEESLLHCGPTGAAALIEWAVKFTDSQEKISLQFSFVSDLLREATYYARAAGASLIRRSHVYHAIAKRHWRSNRADEQIREQILKGTLLIDVSGERVGQVNGLTVYSTGIVSFGKPARITSTVSAGNEGIINIEREVDLSGAIHNKGVLILTGLLRSIFSRSQPISFTASVAFEQSYGGIDGDSASVAEILTLLSAISNIPINQALAITGSINQKGDIQPIGGVNEKITGFFEICKDRGLTGKQGVVIPHQNVKDLMLEQEIIDAVRKGQFAVYPIRQLTDAVELMMGLTAGQIDKNGKFPVDSLFAKVQLNLDVLHEASRNMLPAASSRSL